MVHVDGTGRGKGNVAKAGWLIPTTPAAASTSAPATLTARLRFMRLFLLRTLAPTAEPPRVRRSKPFQADGIGVTAVRWAPLRRKCRRTRCAAVHRALYTLDSTVSNRPDTSHVVLWTD